MSKDCRLCENYLPITDGFGMCNKDELPVMVISEYEPTKNFLQCENKAKDNNKYGQMSYQTEDKSVKRD